MVIGFTELFDKARDYIVTDLLKEFLGNGSINTANVQQWKMCLNGRMLLRVARQQRTNENAGWESRDLFSLWSSLCNSRTVFSVPGPCGGYITRITPAVQFSSR
jgi:hypothetical protein